MLIKNVLASKGDKRVTIMKGEFQKLTKNRKDDKNIHLVYYAGVHPIHFKRTRNGNTWYAQQELPKGLDMPKVGSPVYHDMSLVKDKNSKPIYEQSSFKEFQSLQPENMYAIKPKSELLNNQFEPIRDWATARGLYDKGDVKTQFLKLQEEVGELAKAILTDDKNEIIDAIGDIVVVLTNLTELAKLYKEKKGNIHQLVPVTIEDCINTAYRVIKLRSGKMVNGTFVKDAK